MIDVQKTIIIKLHDAIVRQRGEYASTDDERHQLSDEKLKTRILENLNKTSQKRLQEVIYIVKVYDKDKNKIAIDTFLLKEADLLFGTK